mmetsp:Transcript_18509/g.40065  ORF Transcript_18509/g.40065 Transcript_18509/m.40065 type:complete len:359 (+) Transcript_18509:219-1295(+)|eukprot:CAMPEP_0172309224 /NCGR_PEP_ID=MMETSP1058-20130122/9579_1 /TAXON_ID=83371 /ORGANISM="Detonula confervacea, Strain CCMP 353" /LENGTH=358 /DNA_ID=CAMNT_0013021809 /DNA_START=201 /DNA_END=1277 /DNA_ORIENTATION=+
MIACLITLPAFITLVVLFIWTATSSIFFANDADENGEGRVWWDLDMRSEELEATKILLNLFILAIACVTLFVPISKAGTGMHERFNEGVLAASMFMFGNMLFASFWYLANFGSQEEENNENYYNGYNPYWTMDEKELLAYHQKVVSYVSLALALAFFVVSACIHGGASVLPETGNGSSVRRIQDHTHLAVQFDRMSEMWTLLSLCTIVIFVALFISACILLGGEEAERMREEGQVINLITVLLWMIIVTTVIMTWGNEVFNVKSSGTLGMGMLYGGTKYFASLLFMVCILFANLTLDEKEREEGVWTASATSVACFVLSLFYLIFSMRTRKYQVSLIDSNSEKSGDFVRVDESGMQMT